QATQGGEIGGRGMALDRRRERAAFSPRGRKNYGCIGVVDLLSALAHASPQKLCARRRLSLQRGYPILLFTAGLERNARSTRLAALLHRHIAAEDSGGVVPLQGFGVIA